MLKSDIEDKVKNIFCKVFEAAPDKVLLTDRPREFSCDEFCYKEWIIQIEMQLGLKDNSLLYDSSIFPFLSDIPKVPINKVVEHIIKNFNI